MDIKPIRTDADYRAALKEIEGLMMAKPDTPEGEKLDVLVTLLEAYERKNYPLDLPDPVEAIKKLKARYQRAVDTKDWDLMRSVLAPTARSIYSDGKHA